MPKTITLLLALSFVQVFAQDEKLQKSPKRITFETGYSGLIKTNIPEISKSGFAFAF